MNTYMWNNVFTEKHLTSVDQLGISLIPPVSKRLACGDFGNGAMAEPSLIISTCKAVFGEALIWVGEIGANDDAYTIGSTDPGNTNQQLAGKSTNFVQAFTSPSPSPSLFLTCKQEYLF